jgi:hypothetical protein
VAAACAGPVAGACRQNGLAGFDPAAQSKMGENVADRLDTTKTYMMILRRDGGEEAVRYVGKFVRSYMGDQQRYHEFLDDNGAVVKIANPREGIEFVDSDTYIKSLKTA